MNSVIFGAGVLFIAIIILVALLVAIWLLELVWDWAWSLPKARKAAQEELDGIREQIANHKAHLQLLKTTQRPFRSSVES